jgi:hypothetical protein
VGERERMCVCEKEGVSYLPLTKTKKTITAINCMYPVEDNAFHSSYYFLYIFAINFFLISSYEMVFGMMCVSSPVSV